MDGFKVAGFKVAGLAVAMICLPLAAQAAPAAPAAQRQLVNLEDTRLAVVYSVPGVDLKPYSSVLIEKVVVEYKRGSGNDRYRLKPADIDKLNDYAKKAFTKHLSSDGKYKVVTVPGPGTLIVQAKLDYVSLAFAKDAVHGQSYNLGEYAMQTTLEAELIDGQTGEVLAIVADRQGNRTNAAGPERVTSLDAWQQVGKAFDFWAGSLRKALDEARDGTAKK